MNRSLDLEEITFVKTLLSLLTPQRIAKEWKLIFRDKMIAEIASKPSSNPNSRKLSLNADHKDHFEKISNQVQREISHLGINVHGRMVEAEEGDMASNQPLPTSIHIDTVARAIAAVRPNHHLRQASVREMAREIWYRVLRRLRGIFPKN
jgi:EAL domain-containing protein (putative c-di-GMP-specific phosphodiesterase class I)